MMKNVSKPQDRSLNLTDCQWKLAEQLVKILQPLEIATTLFSYDEHVSLSNVLLVLHSLVETLDKPVESNSDVPENEDDDRDDDRDIGELPAVRDCPTIIKEDINTRWNLDKLKLDSFLVLSTALDP